MTRAPDARLRPLLHRDLYGSSIDLQLTPLGADAILGRPVSELGEGNRDLDARKCLDLWSFGTYDPNDR